MKKSLLEILGTETYEINIDSYEEAAFTKFCPGPLDVIRHIEEHNPFVLSPVHVHGLQKISSLQSFRSNLLLQHNVIASSVVDTNKRYVGLFLELFRISSSIFFRNVFYSLQAFIPGKSI